MTAEQRKIDKSKWTDGPWMREPDRVEFKTVAGLPALITRHPRTGHLCGYVAVNPGHPCHGLDYTTHYEKDDDGEADYARAIPNPVEELSVHGGITYGEACRGEVCRIPEPGEPDDVWWLGFDCNHCDDESPLSATEYGRSPRFSIGAQYRTVEYVRAESESLAEQLAAMVRP